MSGHSKWSTIKHKKAAADSKRGKEFTRVIREIVVAARAGGGDPETNPRLRQAVVSSRAINMPMDNVKRAIQRGTGELPGVTYEEIKYEGFGPEGVALFIEVMTDNSKRTTPEIRHMFSRHGGNLGAPNSVSWMFERCSQFVVRKDVVAEDRLMELVMEAGAEDIADGDGVWEITAPVEVFEAVSLALSGADIGVESAEIARVASNTVSVAGKKAALLIRLLEALEDHEDVQRVWGNMEFDEIPSAQD